eukprot:727624-Amphidinium_carterae.1
MPGQMESVQLKLPYALNIRCLAWDCALRQHCLPLIRATEANARVRCMQRTMSLLSSPKPALRIA